MSIPTGKSMNISDEYMTKEDRTLTIVRLLLEGAISFFEGETQPLFRLAIQNDMIHVANAYDFIGTALLEMRRYIRELQEAQHIEFSKDNTL